jgi:hypothetical protein
MEFAIEVPLLNRQHPTSMLDQSVPLPCEVKVLHWLLLAQGSTRPRLQLLITYGFGAGLLVYSAAALGWRRYHSSHDPSQPLVHLHGSIYVLGTGGGRLNPEFAFIFAVESIVNAFFCNEFCQHNQLQRLIAWVTAHQRENNTPPARSLQKVAWGGWAVCLFFFLFLFLTMEAHLNIKNAEQWLMSLAFELSTSLAMSLVFYLCLLWFWMNWILHTTAQHWVQHRLDADGVLGVGGRDVGRELWEILEQMKAVSSVWGKNHAVRLVSSTGLAAEYERHSNCNSAGLAGHCSDNGGQIFVIAALLYTMVWLMAAVPGYINDMLFSNINRKLYTMWPEPDADPADGQLPPTSVLPVLTRHQRQSHPLTPLEAKTTALMHRAHYLQGREGMHFAFVPMSLARAVTVGTVLGYTIVFATRTAK